MVKKTLMEYGFSSQESDKIILKLHNPMNKDYVQSINENNSYLEKIGFNKNEVMSFVRRLNSFYDLDTKYIENKINEIVSLGVSREEAIDLCKTTSIFGTVGSTKEHMEEVMSVGYTKEDALNLLKKDYNVYLKIGVHKNDILIISRALEPFGILNTDLLSMLTNELKYIDIIGLKSAILNVDVLTRTLPRLLETGLSKSEALNEYEKLYKEIIQQQELEPYRSENKSMSRR